MPATLELHMPAMDLTWDGPPRPLFDLAPAALTYSTPSCTPTMDNFYNGAGKALHLEAIISKQK